MADTKTKPAAKDAPEKAVEETSPTVAETFSDEPPALEHAKQPTRLMNAEHARIVWSHVADLGESFEQMLHRATFVHVAQQLKPGHKIEVHAADGSWYGELYVRSVGRNEVFVAPLNYVEFSGMIDLKDESPYAVAFRGPHMKWCVVSRDTKAVIKDNFDTEAQAGAWVAQHLKALAA